MINFQEVVNVISFPYCFHGYSFFSFVDLMTVVPKFATLNQQCPDLADAAVSLKEVVLYILCGMLTTRILRFASNPFLFFSFMILSNIRVFNPTLAAQSPPHPQEDLDNRRRSEAIYGRHDSTHYHPHYFQ